MIITTPPSRLTFWRLLLGSSAPLAGLTLWESFSLAQKLGVAPLSSKSWILILGALAGFTLLSLALFALTWTSRRENVLEILEIPPSTALISRFFGFILLLAALTAYPALLLHPYYGNLLAKQDFLRLFLFWLFALIGLPALKLAWPRVSWPNAWLITLLFQTAVYQVALYLPQLSDYPFAMGWSETSRFYYPSLFLGREIYGQPLPWPILHPSLHLALVPPYLFDAPLWFHRLWQVAVRFLLVGLIAPALLSRLKWGQLATHPTRWLIGLWIFVYLFTLPLYLHLAVPVFIMLWGFSAHNDRRTWFWLIVASIWAGLSRLNWYPMPGLLAAVLYLLETGPKSLGKSLGSYLVKPALWFIASTAIAFATMRGYIALSGIAGAGDFYTSLRSTLLWERLWPNESYALGVLPGIILFSLPLWLIGLRSLQTSELQSRETLQSYWLILAALAGLFVGGIFVSMKIGGGADLHNMDAYAVMLLVVTAYLVFGRSGQPGHGQTPGLRALPWGLVALLVLVPAWLNLRGTASFWQYDRATSRATLTALQQKVDSVNAGGGQMLFITQRHLIAMKMLENVTLIPEYEREELMEMAMANNDAYLKTFRADMEAHRFAAIVVDPLKFNLVGETDAMGAENNAWTRAVAKKVLCNYRLDALFAADRIAIYVPQEGAEQCP